MASRFAVGARCPVCSQVPAAGSCKPCTLRSAARSSTGRRAISQNTASTFGANHGIGIGLHPRVGQQVEHRQACRRTTKDHADLGPACLRAPRDRHQGGQGPDIDRKAHQIGLEALKRVQVSLDVVAAIVHQRHACIRQRRVGHHCGQDATDAEAGHAFAAQIVGVRPGRQAHQGDAARAHHGRGRAQAIQNFRRFTTRPARPVAPRHEGHRVAG